jgi:hypothetical protein
MRSEESDLPCWHYGVYIYIHTHTHRVIHKSFRDFRPLRYNSQDGHAKGEHVNRGENTPSFCPTLQVLYMSTLGDMADVNPVIKFLPHTVNHVVEEACMCPLCHVIYHSCDEGSWKQSLLSTARCLQRVWKERD